MPTLGGEDDAAKAPPAHERRDPVGELIDAVLGIVILCSALTQHVLPRVPELPSIPAFEWSWAVSNPSGVSRQSVLVAAT